MEPWQWIAIVCAGAVVACALWLIALLRQGSMSDAWEEYQQDQRQEEENIGGR
jgi:hypothetical protein